MKIFLLTFFVLGTFIVQAQEKKNILFLFADDMGRYASAYRDIEKNTPNDIIVTPHIDRIAKEGVLFRNAFVNAPSCTPCRSALLTGQYFYRTKLGAILQNAEWDDSIPAFPLLLQKAGYHIGKSFKVWSPGKPADAPFGQQKHAYESSGRQVNQFSEYVTDAIKRGENREKAKEVLYQQVRENFRQFLAANQEGKPFLYWYGPTNVHRTWIKGSGKALWDMNPDLLEGKLPPFLPDVPEVREDFCDYLGEVQAFDACIGVIIDELKAAGLYDQTVIVISGDHGAPGFPRGKCNLYDFGTNVTLAVRHPDGKGGRVLNDFVNLMDLAPTFLEIGDVEIPKVVTGKSILPLLFSDEMGQIDESRDYVVTGRERHVGFAREGNLPYPQRAIRVADFLYIRNFHPDRWPIGLPLAADQPAPNREALENKTYEAYADMDASPSKAWVVQNRYSEQGKFFHDLAFAKRPGEELYDLKKDPHQIQNVAALPEYAETKKKLAERLMKVLQETGDPRVQGDGSTFDQEPYTRDQRKQKK